MTAKERVKEAALQRMVGEVRRRLHGKVLFDVICNDTPEWSFANL